MSSELLDAAGYIAQKENIADLLPDGRVQAYPDPSLGWKCPTIGYGTTVYPDTGKKVARGDVRSQLQCVMYLFQWIDDRVLPGIRRLPTYRWMSRNQVIALTSFGYNLGTFYGGRNFQSITRLVDQRQLWTDEDEVRDIFGLYVKSGGKRSEGLVNRRRHEAELWLTP